MKTLIYPIIRIKCDTPKCKGEGVFEGYDHASLEGWIWSQKDGWACGKCTMATVGQTVGQRKMLL